MFFKYSTFIVLYFSLMSGVFAEGEKDSDCSSNIYDYKPKNLMHPRDVEILNLRMYLYGAIPKDVSEFVKEHHGGTPRYYELSLKTVNEVSTIRFFEACSGSGGFCSMQDYDLYVWTDGRYTVNAFGQFELLMRYKGRDGFTTEVSNALVAPDEIIFDGYASDYFLRGPGQYKHTFLKKLRSASPETKYSVNSLFWWELDHCVM